MQFVWTPRPPRSTSEATLIFWPCVTQTAFAISLVLFLGLYDYWIWTRTHPLKLTMKSRKLVQKGPRWSKKKEIWDRVTMSVQQTKNDKKEHPVFVSTPTSIWVFGERKLVLWQLQILIFWEIFIPFHDLDLTPPWAVSPQNTNLWTPPAGVSNIRCKKRSFPIQIKKRTLDTVRGFGNSRKNT